MTTLINFTISVRKILQSTLMQLVCEEVMFFFVWVDFYFSKLGQHHPKCQRAVRLVYPPFFPKLRSSSNPTNKHLTELVLEIQIAQSRWLFRIRHKSIWTFPRPLPLYPQWPILSPPKVLIFPPESPCISRWALENVKRNSKFVCCWQAY